MGYKFSLRSYTIFLRQELFNKILNGKVVYKYLDYETLFSYRSSYLTVASQGWNFEWSKKTKNDYIWAKKSYAPKSADKIKWKSLKTQTSLIIFWYATVNLYNSKYDAKNLDTSLDGLCKFKKEEKTKVLWN